MQISIRDINTGQIVQQRNQLKAQEFISNDCHIIAIKTVARRLFDATSEHPDFVYWVAVTRGKAIHKGQF